MTQRVRTRFAPSPTSSIHLGNIRSALYPWAFARKTRGDFILRIEDADVERSSQEVVDVILEAMDWLDMDIDEGPFYQMQRMDRYRVMVAQMMQQELAYPCYMSTEELDALREAQRERDEKPRYDDTWRPVPGKVLPPPPAGVQPVIRFKNPIGGGAVWDDAVKGHIETSNDELNDLVVARPDGMPTCNFCVIVDDMDMQTTHVIRGDDHVNNTPRQINILRVLGGTPPVYAHLPAALNEQGEKMSKRHGAMTVTGYRDAGYLPEAIVNYLVRLDWAHGDAEIFSREQFTEWFDLEYLSRSPAQYNPEKLTWLNNHCIKQADNVHLADLVKPFIEELGGKVDGGPVLADVIALVRDRANTLREVAQTALLPYRTDIAVEPKLAAQHLTDDVRPGIAVLAEKPGALPEWKRKAIGTAFKEVLAAQGWKMSKLAMPVRLLVAGQLQTPSIDAVLELFGRDVVLRRLDA